MMLPSLFLPFYREQSRSRNGKVVVVVLVLLLLCLSQKRVEKKDGQRKEEAHLSFRPFAERGDKGGHENMNVLYWYASGLECIHAFCFVLVFLCVCGGWWHFCDATGGGFSFSSAPFALHHLSSLPPP